jgi:uncharacterized protein YjbI with pentapeptide repeats
MDDNTRAALDSETPVNPYSLLDALNTAAARSNALWLLLLGVMAYIAVTVAALTHRDLLLDAGIVLPLLGVRIDLARFFVAAPAVFALLHLALVVQFVLLARKALEFDGAVRLLESTDLRSHPLRLELDSFFFVQSIAGPERARAMSAVLHALAWASLLVLPLALLIYLQIAFLPFHDALITAAQRVVLLADIALVLLAGVFLLRPETSFPGAFLRLALHNPGSLAFGLAVLAGAAVVSLFLAAVPRGASDGAPGALFGIFPRSIDVADTDVVSGKDRAAAPARSVSLRGRDLRFARLDRADLSRADLTGANLDGASLAGADLTGARLGCASPAALQQPDGRARAGCTSARGADFTAARLSGASLAGADLRGAAFDDAALEAADLGRGLMSGATFERAKLRRADLSGASLQGASFVAANLHGALLSGAGAQAADFSGADLQGASLASAHLAGAVLREADLEGAELQGARLYATDLAGATLQGADLAGAAVWRTVPPGGDAVALADLAGIAIKPPGKDEIEAIKAAASIAALPSAERTTGERTSGERAGGVQGLLQGLGESGWASSADGQAWAGLLRAASEGALAEGFKARLSEHLGRLACHPRFADGAIAAGVVRRALGPGFKGDTAALAERLKAADCLGAKALPAAMLLELSQPAAAGRGQ